MMLKLSWKRQRVAPFKIAPVVKWISQLTSDQLFWVRVLAGAQRQNTKDLLLKPVFCVLESKLLCFRSSVQAAGLFSAPSKSRKSRGGGEMGWDPIRKGHC